MYWFDPNLQLLGMLPRRRLHPPPLPDRRRRRRTRRRSARLRRLRPASVTRAVASVENGAVAIAGDTSGLRRPCRGPSLQEPFVRLGHALQVPGREQIDEQPPCHGEADA
jgi:hypothetical protein